MGERRPPRRRTPRKGAKKAGHAGLKPPYLYRLWHETPRTEGAETAPLQRNNMALVLAIGIRYTIIAQIGAVAHSIDGDAQGGKTDVSVQEPL